MFLCRTDNHGNVITLACDSTYGTDSVIFAHPLLTKVTLNHDTTRAVEISYNISGGVVTSISVGDFDFDIRCRPGTSQKPTLSDRYNRGYLTKITDPAGRGTEFEYERYVRGIYDWTHDAAQFTNENDCQTVNKTTANNIYPDFFRLSEVRTPRSGLLKFEYYKEEAGLDSLRNPKYDASSYGYYMEVAPSDRYEDYFKEMGRDPFFSNVVTLSSEYQALNSAEQLVSKDTLEYDWWVTDTIPVYAYQYSDSFFTDIYTDSTTNPKTNGSHRHLVYMSYPYSDHSYLVGGTDTKYELFWKFALLRLDTDYDTTYYDYDESSCEVIDGDDTDDGCSGKLRTIEITTNKSGKSYSDQYAYEVASDTFNLSKITTTKSLGTKIEKELDEQYLTVSDSTSLYINSQPSVAQIRKTSGNTLLAQSGYRYYTDSTADGNKGQLKEIIKYFVESGSVSDSAVTTVSYHHNSTQGYGNIKKVTRPETDSVLLYYHLPDSTISSDTFNVSYTVAEFDGDERFCRERLTNYKSAQTLLSRFLEKNGNDDTLNLYMLYNNRGQIVRMINELGYVSLYDYDDIRRILHIAQPLTVDTVTSTSNVISRDDIEGYGAYYAFDDTTDDSSLTHTNIMRRHDLSDSIINDTIICVVSAVRDEGYDDDYDTIPRTQNVWWSLVLPGSGGSCGTGGYAGIYNQDTLIYLLTCDSTTYHKTGSFTAQADDSVTVKVNAAGDEPDDFFKAKFSFEEWIDRPDSVFWREEYETRYEFDGRLNIVRTENIGNDDTITVTSEFDHLGLQIDLTDQLGYSTATQYDEVGRKIKTIYPDSAASYDSLTHGSEWMQNLPSSVTDHTTMADSFLTYTVYTDENGRSRTEFGDAAGQKRFILRLLGDDSLWTVFDYDLLGNMIKIVRPASDSVCFAYNSLNRLTKEWSADCDTIFYEYDKNGRLIKVKDGNLTDKQSGSEDFWRYSEYDAFDRVSESGLLDSDADTSEPIRRYFYDQHGPSRSRGKLSVSYSTDAGYRYGEKYDYDAQGRVAKSYYYFDADLDSTYNDSIFVELAQSADSVVERMVVPLDTVVDYHLECNWNWDSDSYIAVFKNSTRIDSLSTTGPLLRDTVEGSFGVDAGDTVSLVAYIEGDSVTCYFYGVASYEKFQIPQYYLVSNNHNYSIEYTYDYAGHIQSIVYPDGMTVTYSYDEYGRLESVGDTADADYYARFYYSDRNEVDSMITGDRLQVVDYAYNARGWINTINDGTSEDSVPPDDLFGERLYYYYPQDGDTSYNGNVMRQSVDLAGTAGATYDYTYDDLNRLSDVLLMSFVSESFSYDDNGNFDTVYNYDRGTTYYNYTSGTNQLESLDGDTTAAYSHDASGNLSYDSVKAATFYYDVFNQLRMITLPPYGFAAGDSVLYGYSNFGERICKIFINNYTDTCGQGGGGKSGPGFPPDPPPLPCPYRDTTVTLYLRGQGGEVLAEYGQLLNSLQAKYIYANGERIAMYNSLGHLHFYISDHLGSTRAVVRATDSTVVDWNYLYWAFGSMHSETVNLDQDYLYTAKPFDDDGAINLYFYGERYYEPILGRFMGVDPAAANYPSWSPYVYTLNNPIRLIDPNGMLSFQKNGTPDPEPWQHKAPANNLWGYGEDESQGEQNGQRGGGSSGTTQQSNEQAAKLQSQGSWTSSGTGMSVGAELVLNVSLAAMAKMGSLIASVEDVLRVSLSLNSGVGAQAGVVRAELNCIKGEVSSNLTGHLDLRFESGGELTLAKVASVNAQGYYDVRTGFGVDNGYSLGYGGYGVSGGNITERPTTYEFGVQALLGVKVAITPGAYKNVRAPSVLDLKTALMSYRALKRSTP